MALFVSLVVTSLRIQYYLKDPLWLHSLPIDEIGKKMASWQGSRAISSKFTRELVEFELYGSILHQSR
ncbi:hypothetical protein QVD17_00493 [Tagetes erecta]|uniref:Uncharacterized protein n=1 Tax=Tagetes erecta TaxID=13708 RepID=A0AAD8L573_TARER|nr:hypothetical protein QVD17_00493 [Tagetes erecta]